MQETLTRIVRDGGVHGLDGLTASFDQVHDLMGMSEVLRLERIYLSG